MRIGVRVERVPLNADLEFGPICAEWLVDQSAEHDIVVACDQDGPGPDALRDAGVSVFIAPKRIVHTDAGSFSSDAAQARLLGDLHDDSEFGCIIDGAEMLVATRDLESRLEGVPHGVAIGRIWADLPLVASDPVLFDRYGRRMAAAAGFLAAADFCLADVQPEVLGLRSERLPPVVFTQPEVVASGPPAQPVRLLVVAATTLDRTTLAGAPELARTLVPTDEGTTVVLIHRDTPLQHARSRNMITAALPPTSRLSTILVPIAPDGVAAEFVEAADCVVWCSPAEQGIPALFDRAREDPPVIIGKSASTERARMWPDVGGRLPPNRGVLLPWDATGMEAAVSAHVDGGATGVVLYTAEGALDAGQMQDRIDWGRTDVAVTARPDGAFGSPQPGILSPYVLGFSAAVAPAVMSFLRSAEGMWDLISMATDPSLFEFTRLRMLPSRTATGHRDLPRGQRVNTPPWLFDRGVLPRPTRISAQAVTEAVTALSQAPVPDVKKWAEQHRWSDRARLLLPWKWGLLPRAMKGKW